MTGGAMGAVTVPYWVKNKRLKLSDLTPAEMAQVYRTGRARDLLTIGDLTAPVPLVGTIAGTAFNTAVTYRLVHIDEQGLVFILATNEDGVEIALSDASYNNQIASNANGFCMNRKGQVGTNAPDTTLPLQAQNTGPTKGGWADCYARVNIMQQVLSALPAAWRIIISQSRIWANNIGNGSDDIQDYRITLDKIFLPSCAEVVPTHRMTTNNIIGHAMVFNSPWEWYLANKMMPYKINDITVRAQTMCRDVHGTDVTNWLSVSTTGGVTIRNAAHACAMKYAFRIF